MIDVGRRLRLVQVIGQDAPLQPGAVGVVDEIVPAEVDGAGTHDEDHAVLNFEIGGATRRVSFTADQLEQWFVDHEEAPE